MGRVIVCSNIRPTRASFMAHAAIRERIRRRRTQELLLPVIRDDAPGAIEPIIRLNAGAMKRRNT